MAEDTENKISFEVAVPGSKEAADDVDAVVAALERERAALKALNEAVDQSDFAARIAAYRAEADKLNATQAQTAVTLRQVTAESERAATALTAQGQAVLDNASKFSGFGEAASQAIGGLTPSVKQLQDALEPARKAVDEFIASEQGLASLPAPAVPQLPAATPDISGASALQGLGQQLGGDSSGIQEELANAISEGIGEGIREALAQGAGEIPEDLGPILESVHQQFIALFGPENSAEITSALGAAAADGLESGLREAFAEAGGEIPQEMSAALAQARAQIAAFEAEKNKLSADGSAIRVAAEAKQVEALEAAKVEQVKASVALQGSAVLEANAELIATLKDKFEALQEDELAISKTGLGEQRTEIEKQLGAEVDALRKRLTDANLGSLLVSGGKEAVEALGKEVDTLAQKLGAVKAMNEAADQSGFLSRMAAYRAEAAALNAEEDKNASALKKLAGGLADTTAGLETNTVKLRSQVGAGAGAISQLGHAFAEVVPEVAGFQNAIDIGMRSLGGILGVIGGGPGIVLGGLVAGIGILGAVMSSAKKDADELAKSTTANKEALEAYLDEIDSHKGQASTKSIDDRNEQRGTVTTHQIKVTGEEDLQKALERATASISQYDTEITLLQKKIADNEAQMKLDISMSWSELQRQSQTVIPALKNENEGFREQIELLKQRRDVAKEYADAEKANAADKKALEDALANAGSKQEKSKTFDFNAPEAAPAAKKPVDEASATQKRLDENLASINKLRDLQTAADDKQKAQDEALLKYRSDNEIQSASETIKAIQDKYALAGLDRKALLHADLQQQKEDIESQINEAIDATSAHTAEQTVQVEAMRREAMQETHQQFLALEDEKFAAVQKNIQEEQSKRQQMTQSLMALGTTAAQLAAKQLSEAVKGHKINGALILESLGDAMVAEGVRVMFQGAAMSLMGNFVSGAGLLALGAAEMGVGLGLGAAGSAAQPPSATSGNGASTTPASPIHDTQQTSNSDSQRGPTIIYLNMPTVVSPSPEDGLRVQQAIDAASRVYGAPV